MPGLLIPTLIPLGVCGTMYQLKKGQVRVALLEGGILPGDSIVEILLRMGAKLNSTIWVALW